MKQRLIVAINISNDQLKRLSRITLNVSAKSAAALVPNPIRTNLDVSGGPPAGGAAPPDTATRFYFFAWPYGLDADTIPTVSLNAEYLGQTITKEPDPKNAANTVTLTTQSRATTTIAQETLPQVHALSSYNIDAGVVYSTVRTKSFGFDSVTKNPFETGSTPIIDPVLFFTYYPRPIDAEREWQATDLIPGIVLGISLSSPSSNFYIGGSSEIRRGIQLVYGLTAAKGPQLAPSNTFNSTSATAPATVQKFKTGAYIGLSFNFKSFVGTLFSGGGKGSN